ncbi:MULTISPECIES: hypothetical protein [unclassified Mesorhizobium]|uniref:hypothetical protein n=1 Tax=unclassified Mesorhizobium TaxID=325217 RepID=UPI000FCA9E10|nr:MULTISPECIES: hypothetical protein [unclassified Mesorhizobium]RUX97434.1 hypothetical protein EN993_03795 [Mesorhizobium sp. M7D.F.Ca.US.004.01.2.1]RVA36620.1 hypothetical protein EN935_01605 [Mesorhizobium sp. M7D.F.Ca.US.004.03.1.1]
MVKIVSFPAKPKKVVSLFEAAPIPADVIVAMGLQSGLVMYGGRFHATKLGKDEVRPLLRHAD